MTRMNRIILAAIGLVAGAVPATAQSPLLDVGGQAAWLQVQRASFADPGHVVLADAGASFRVTTHTDLVASLPFAWASKELSNGDKSTLFGNPYIGIRQAVGSAAVELGARLPAVGDNAGPGPALGGALADFDQFEAYVPIGLAVAFSFSDAMVPEAGNGVISRMKIGMVMIKPKQNSGGESEAFGAYGGMLGYRSGILEAGAAITGRMRLTHINGASLSDLLVNQLTLGAGLRRAGVSPTLFVRLPLSDQISQALSAVIGVGVTVPLR